jgi:hypothetical protein
MKRFCCYLIEKSNWDIRNKKRKEEVKKLAESMKVKKNNKQKKN